MTDRPAPPVPADCDLSDFKFMPLDVARLRDSDLASNETPQACWAAVLLWSASWHQTPAASIPNDERWIAKQAGYAQRGRIDREWSSVREGALRGFVECSDGRLYHAVVAEKAREAWQAKLEQRWRSECARIKKHNDRHPGANVQKPTFDDWMSEGCPQGQRLFVPRDKEESRRDNPRDIGSKRQGEGQGQGQGQGEGQGQIDNPSGEGGKPPKSVKNQADEEKSRIWAALKTSLVFEKTCKDLKEAGVLLGRAASKYGQDVFLPACRETLAEERADTHSYLVAACERQAGKRPSSRFPTAMNEVENAMANLVPGVASRNSSAPPKGTHAASHQPAIEVEARHVPIAESR